MGLLFIIINHECRSVCVIMCRSVYTVDTKSNASNNISTVVLSSSARTWVMECTWIIPSTQCKIPRYDFEISVLPFKTGIDTNTYSTAVVLLLASQFTGDYSTE